MFFPIIVPSKLGTNTQAVPPKIKTLENYTHLSNKEFTKHFRQNIDNVGLFESIEMISIFYNFDNESEKQKRKIVDFVEQPGSITIRDIFKKFFKIK
jgi:hypothetical protein